MGVVHRHQRLSGLPEALHPAWCGLQMGADLCRLLQGQAAHPQAGQHAQEIGHVVLSDQVGFQERAFALLFLHRELQPRIAIANIPRH